jgi:hypothetical protein
MLSQSSAYACLRIQQLMLDACFLLHVYIHRGEALVNWGRAPAAESTANTTATTATAADTSAAAATPAAAAATALPAGTTAASITDPTAAAAAPGKHYSLRM